jgi:CoA:oxalate CoA-transferase
MPDQALGGIKVLDLGHHIAGPYCTKLLADFGAQVIKVERPDGGDPARRAGPFPNDELNLEESGLFFYLNNNKRGITLNLKTDTGIKIFQELVKKVDILVENFSPRVMPGLGLSYDSLKIINPGLVMTSISNFGQSGPYRDYKATDIVLQALGGYMWGRGEPTREPVRGTGQLEISELVGGVYAASGTMAAFTHKIQTGIGQQVDISLMEAVVCVQAYPMSSSTFPRNLPWPQKRMTFVPSVEECKDGYVGVNVLTGPHWVSLCAMMGMDDWAEHPDYRILIERLKRPKDVHDRMHPWLMARTKEEILQEGQTWRIPFSPVYSSEDIMRSPQYQARDSLAEIEHPALGGVTQPGAPFRMSETPWQVKSPAPLLGQDNEELYGELLGYSKEDLVKFRQAGVI